MRQPVLGPWAPPLLALLVLAVAACAGSGSPGPASTVPPPSAVPASAAATPSAPTPAEPTSPGPLVTVAFRGGHCRQGPCDRALAIGGDGRVSQVEPERRDLGSLPPDAFQEIRQQLSVADFGRLGSRPFTGECPVNYDGQELIYTFHGATGDIRLASCEVDIDPTHPLFAAIERALASVPVP